MAFNPDIIENLMQIFPDNIFCNISNQIFFFPFYRNKNDFKP